MRIARRFIRPASSFILLTTIFNLFLPNFSFALTSGPTAPEATSFEPVDTTDMVNLVTGDFTYNAPLLEIPGPAGGYPLSLSYHAGIQPNEDASWVGLGWTLNPGAINRNVNGYADDLNDVTATSRMFWEGGSYHSYNAGVSVGQAGSPAIQAGLSYSQDTYRGITESAFINVGSVGLNTSTSVSNGHKTSSTGITAGIGAGSAGSFTVGYNTSGGMNGNFEGNGASLASTVNGMMSMDVSMKTVKNMALSKVGVQAETFNSKSGNVRTKGYNYAATIPLGDFSVNLGTSYKRYWSDETTTATLQGSLYMPLTPLAGTQIGTKAFDTYDLPFVVKNELGNPKINYSDGQLAGTFIDYDQYSVSAQGISGSMRPYHFKSTLYRQTKFQTDGTTIATRSYGIGNTLKPHFRFEGDFSNRYDYTNTTFSTSANSLAFDFSALPLTGENGNDGYIPSTNSLAGSRYVEWYSNIRILDPSSAGAKADGFIDCAASGFARQQDGQVGGFKIVNESGVTYHYALPVYSLNEYSYSGYKDIAGKDYFNQYSKPGRYAYTWLLTAVTGPDFVDRNSNGLVDQGDWGYWVGFDYGLWADYFGWRNPSEGYNKDVDRKFNNFSKGQKQVYYLNKIRTATHTAVFVKEERPDGKGTTCQYPQAVTTNNNSVNFLDNGGFDVLTNPNNGNNIYPISTLRLAGIYLFKNQDFTWANLSNLSSTYTHLTGGIEINHGFAVIDVQDLATIPNNAFAQASVRSIIFNHDYSLCPGTSNSFYNQFDVLGTSKTADPSNKLGKLTLNSLTMNGKGGVSLLPPTKFSYDLSLPDNLFTANLQLINGADLSIDPSMDIYSKITQGDLFTFDQDQIIGLGYVDQILLDRITAKYIFAPRWTDKIKNFRLTKNPPYFKDCYDMWGMFKSDFSLLPDDSPDALPENPKRMTTFTSGKSADVWSLRKITSPLGSTIAINYESDTYKDAVKKLTNLEISKIEPYGTAGQLKVTFYSDITNTSLAVGGTCNISALLRRHGVSAQGNKVQCNGDDLSELYLWTSIISDTSPNAHIDGIGPNYVIVTIVDSGLAIEVNRPPSQVVHIGNTYGATDIASDPPYILGTSEVVSAHMTVAGLVGGVGGGIRVKSIQLTSMDITRETSYEYSNGITSYEPLGLDAPTKVIPTNFSSCIKAVEKQAIDDFTSGSYYKSIYGNFIELFAASRELPAPGVFYGLVTMREKVYHNFKNYSVDVPGYSSYEFEVFSPTQIAKTPLGTSDELPNQCSPGTAIIDGFNINEVKTGPAKIEDFTSRVGLLRGVTFYNKDGIKIKETRKEFLHDNTSQDYRTLVSSKFNNQGVIKETFVDARFVIPSTCTSVYKLLGTASQKITYPAIQTAQVETDYKTGIVSRTENNAFDFYTGAATSTVTKDGYGSIYLTTTTPAYKSYPAMGLIINGGKNMLTQEAETTVFKVSGQAYGTKLGLVSASVQTWGTGVPVVVANAQSIWRKKASYVWKGDDSNLGSDGLYPPSSFVDFANWVSIPPANSQWQKQDEVTLYDYNSHALEASDINGHFMATKMSSDQSLVLTSVANASYNEFAFSGAEDVNQGGFYGGGVAKGTISVQEVQKQNPGDYTTVHTGSKALKVTATTDYAFQFTALGKAGRTYRASVWANSSSGRISSKVNGVTGPQSNPTTGNTVANQAGAWYLINLDIPVTGATDVSIELWCETSGAACNFDDFRVHPIDAAMSSYVYNGWGELSHILDTKNLYTEYQYDDMGRLVKVYKESFKNNRTQTSETQYHYGAQ